MSQWRSKKVSTASTQSARQALDPSAPWPQVMLEVWGEAKRQWLSLWTAGPQRGWRGSRSSRQPWRTGQ